MVKPRKKIIFVTPPYHCGVVEVAGSWPPLGFVYLGAQAQKAGWDVEIYDAMTLKHDFDKIRKKLVKTDFDILATVHDSVEVQCNAEDAEKVATLLKVVLPMTDDFQKMYGIKFVVPFEVDVEVGTSFGHLTEAKFSNKGNLLNGKEIQSFLQDAQSSCTN